MVQVRPVGPGGESLSMRARLVLLLLWACLAAAASRADAPPESGRLWLREPALSPDGTRIAFRHRGQIWIVPASGGAATALTPAGTHAAAPAWSPDGRTLAFASDRFGALNVFAVPAAGGEIRRLTWYGLDERPMSVAPDGRVLFAARRLGDAARTFAPPNRTEMASQVYAVPLAGGRETLVLPNAALDARSDPGGKRLLYTSPNVEQRFRQHQVSRAVRQVWLYDAATGRHERLTEGTRESRNAVWLPGDEIAYLSEASGSLNVWRLSLAERVPRQLTFFAEGAVRWLSASAEGDLVFAREGALYRLARGAAEPEVIPVTVTESAFAGEVPARSSEFSDLAVSPTGQEVALVAQGDISVAARDGKSVKRITRGPGEARNPTFSPDGRRLAYAAERDGRWGLYETSLAVPEETGFAQATRLVERRLPSAEGDALVPRYAPDGRRLAYVLDRAAVHILDLASGADREVVPPGRFYAYDDGRWWLAWSPDSRWLALPIQGEQSFATNVAVVPADGSRPPLRVAPAGEAQGDAQWSADGSFLLWRSDASALHRALGDAARSDVDAVFTSRRAREAFEARLRLPVVAEPDGPARPSGTGPAPSERVQAERAARPALPTFDPDGLEDRQYRLSQAPGDVVHAGLMADGVGVLTVEQAETPAGDGWMLTGTLRDLRLGRRRILFSGVASKRASPVRLSRDQRSLYALSRNGFEEIDLARGTVRSVRVQVEAARDPARTLREAFAQYGRLTRAKFLDPGMHGVDWEAAQARYARFLPALADPRDLAELLSEMAGELNASHTGAFLVPAIPADERTASLGLYYDEAHAGPGMRVAAILPGGPFDAAGTRLAPGDVLTEIDGAPIPEAGGVHRLLRGRANRLVEIAFRKPDGSEVRERRAPVSLDRERDLAFERWQRARRDAVVARSCGRLGYVHVRAMDARSYRRTFAELFGRFAQAEGLIVDVRFNGGGNLHNQLLTLLSGRPYLTFSPRSGPPQAEPANRWTKPSAVLMNAASYSDASIFPQGYRDLGIGPLIGDPVAGTGTFVWWVPSPIVPRLAYGLPQLAIRRADGRLLENTDILPDVAVPSDPTAWAEGRDPQLEAAVAALLGAGGAACGPAPAANAAIAAPEPRTTP
ncbi:peptidase S41 [Methylobacterium sp. 4-46]|nr:peptidase S41 [Methylobacterium sp. 4-46]